MKFQNLFIFFSILMALILSGCQDEFTEIAPQGQLTSANFWQNEEHAELATNAVYEHLRAWEVHVFSFIGMTDIISDDADKGSFTNDAPFLLEIDNFTFTPTNVAPLTVWDGYYQGIFRTNQCIEFIPGIDMDENLKSRLVAESRVVRAYFYLNLVRWFGDVPLILKTLGPDEFQQPRVPADQIFQQIIADLEAGEAILPETYPSSETGRITKWVAKGLLMRVYLTLKGFPRAEQYALEIINSGQFDLFPNYAQLFREEAENSVESIFEIQSGEGQRNSSQYNQVQGVRGVPNLGWGFNRPSDDLIRSYEPGDPRLQATVLYVGEVLPDGTALVEDNPNLTGERFNQKSFVSIPESGNNAWGPGNIRNMRFAEVLLTAAETLNENGKSQEALVHLNRVRARARGNNPNILPDITTTDQAELRGIIWHERRVELALEQHRWFDLLRQDRVADVMKGVGKPFVEGKHELFPIPQNEIDLSGGSLSQNPGYN